MGRIKQKGVKVLATELMRQHTGKFTTNFEKNKKILGELLPIKYKKIRNLLAGYITKKMSQAKAAK